jgi:antitoxin VapB
MKLAKLFRNGRSQAVRLPAEFRFAGDEVVIKRVGNGVLLLPRDNPWGDLFASLGEFSGDFLVERDQGQPQRRKKSFR